MSAILLAELLDQLSVEGGFLKESESDVSVSGLPAKATTDVIEICKGLGWDFSIFDSAETEWPNSDVLDPAFGPYRLRIRKPSLGDGKLVLLTNSGFAEWLKIGHAAVNWQVARLKQRIITLGRVLEPWGDQEAYIPSNSAKNPRALVREYGAERFTPDDIRPWLAHEQVPLPVADSAAEVWKKASAFALVHSLANEVDPNTKKLKFTGPPKLSVSVPNQRNALDRELPADQFSALQRAAMWVYENERETELRHSLMANEIARSASGNDDDFEYFLDSLSASLEGAKVAYQVSISDLGKDTLKMLADLRKAVTEETAKVTDITRQLVTSVAGALAISLGLIAARVNAAASSGLIVTVMLVVAVYVGVVIYSGYGFIQLQRQLRKDWQPRLYRFLPSTEYENMVNTPARKAERTFFGVAWGGGLGVAALTFVVVFGWWSNANNTQTVNKLPIQVGSELDNSANETATGDVEASDDHTSQTLPNSRNDADTRNLGDKSSNVAEQKLEEEVIRKE